MTGIMAVTLGVTAFVVGVAYGVGGCWFVMQRIGDENAD